MSCASVLLQICQTQQVQISCKWFCRGDGVKLLISLQPISPYVVKPKDYRLPTICMVNLWNPDMQFPFPKNLILKRRRSTTGESSTPVLLPSVDLLHLLTPKAMPMYSSSWEWRWNCDPEVCSRYCLPMKQISVILDSNFKSQQSIWWLAKWPRGVLHNQMCLDFSCG